MGPQQEEMSRQRCIASLPCLTLPLPRFQSAWYGLKFRLNGGGQTLVDQSGFANQSKRATPVELLCSGAELWLTNVLVFALWYWRLDGGGPTLRQQSREFGSRSFVFPQMQIEKAERGRFECSGWRPHFIDYLFIALTQSSTFGPTDAPLLARWAKILASVQICISLTIVILLISRAVGVL